MKGLNLRQAENKDFLGILSLLETLSQTRVTQDKVLKMFREILKSKFYSLWVATVNGKVIGTASIFFAPSLAHGKNWGLIDNVVVAEEYRRKGIGRKLVEVLVNFAKKKNCYKIILTSRFSRPEVHQFWQKLGFEKHGYSFRMDL